ncbi:HNH endonuclease signature motif containing protein [Streptococcus oralis]|uniref:Putative TIGR02646 family protein n=1 Tax=Streptococcus oralis ATCC 49296 TaxID=888049 RepID=E6KIE9_STROR|nr:HNH endonuclease signature motif containing protein [Streptococcus oralis]EFU64157.1 putative TIGR02646 family protein [Streptococcus oralis ATCC 49296]
MNYIRKLYKQDYRGFESLPHRRENVIEKYSVKSQRSLLKEYLVEDFEGKCIYCGWNCKRYGAASFHIEHIKSQIDNKALIDDYNNLALSCPICNTTKNKKPLPSNLDPLGEEYKKLFYRNNRGAIVTNNDISEVQRSLAEKYIKTLGLSKELYKLDYVYSSLNIIKRKSNQSEQKNESLICSITEVLDFIDDNYFRNSQLKF